MTDWVEVADRVLVWRQPVLDVNAVLVLGDAGALVVDTLSTPAQATELADAIRRVTPLPWRVVNTHHHFDHCYGNAVLAPDADTEVWAHTECLARYDRWIAEDGGKERVAAIAAEFDIPGLETVTLRGPDRAVPGEVTLDLGGRTVDLRHLGRGHTDNDLVVVVPDAAVVLAGDLLEDGAPPSFDDSWPLEWAGTVAALIELGPSTVVPGHGNPMTPDAVAAQHAELAALEWACRDGWRDHAPAEEVAAKAPFGSVLAVQRAYAFLDGAL
ncbi:MBL fold metallo-hydrolase [Cryptosporangium aurantiacum]|uniref:Glyoxylase, beta-lactamase superfamily II n=1 Tax=Cryptosporangium aurantiacum TaxID=134849 RepID=A0A1M7JAM0_9ACTN|nr:MBL fold metallo-hydrolase [Cryptosporangium aurantiacum]SHM50052.1 Glyoxylase, beta-lactamase superfamily II [Cryptosporangium aurantiacum]